MKKDLGVKGYLFPQLVMILSTFDENKKVDIMNAAWGGTADTDKIFICLDHSHKTTKNILLNKGFTLALGVKKYVKECDYVGIVSANDDTNKIDKIDWTYSESKNVKAPIINELPLTLECELISYDESSDYLFAKIVNVVCEDNILDDKNRIDVSKLEAISYSPFDHGYYLVKEKVGNAFKDGLEIKNRK